MKPIKHMLAATAVLAFLAACQQDPHEYQDPTPDLAELRAGFENPPNEARPRVWWHWMNGNVTLEGITADLEWMERTGIGGFQNFDANLFTPVVVDQKLVFMTPPWKEAFKHATDLAVEKGLEMTIAGSPGWSVTGGPWVEPRDGMKKYVWSEMVLEGGTTYDGKLPEPITATGSFQNAAGEGGIEMSEGHIELPEFYEDAAVVAYRVPDGEVPMARLAPRVSSSGGHFTLEALTDGDVHTATELPPGQVGEEVWIQYSFDSPQTFRSYSVVGANHSQLEQFRGSPQNRKLYVSNDGVNFRKVVDIPGTLNPQTSGSFPETSARHWRFAYETLPPAPAGVGALFGAPAPAKPDGVPVAEFVLYQADRIDRFEDKAGFSAWSEETETYRQEADAAIPADEVIDLTDQVTEDGFLNWEVPDGKWKVVRLGYSLTGRQNHPASPEATGLEVDKLDEEAVRRYINHYLDLYADATGGQLGESGLGYIILDSYEAGHMNWTHDMPAEFEARRGYSIKPWIPVLTGRVVQSREASEKFLWDFRKTIGEMIADNHYDAIGEELKKRGMGRYTESHEGNRIYLADGMDVKRNADVPMSAMWTPGSLAGGSDEEVRSEGDIRESASVANIYGKPYVAAESMTSIQNAFSWHPAKLKRTADLELASGLNRYVIHTSVHQPLDGLMPGFSLGPFGQYFTRQETWSGAGAKAWINYLARSSYLLQQGRNVADVLYLYGENDNITHITQESLPDIPEGHEFDFVSAAILKEAVTAANGQLKTLGGATYKMLQLDPGTARMTLSTLQKLRELADAGVKIKGSKPVASPSLADDPEVFSAVADATWSLEHVGADVSLDVPQDVVINGTDHEILFRHRRAGEIDIYWLNNRSEGGTRALASFRVSGRKPELWDPQTGAVHPVSYKKTDGRTVVDLDMAPWGSVFVVFAGEATEDLVELPEFTEESLHTLQGPWEVTFEEGRGASGSITLESLASLSEHADDGVKYFSGTATYTQSFDRPEASADAGVWLDLGAVHNLAEVILNGQSMGVAWKAPYRIEITEALKDGANQLEIRVTNTWVNRLIGDAQPGVTEKITFTTMPFYNGTEPLLPSGLVGPVRLLKIK
ncbi:glycosyl hydrolase [Robiginitalea biformata]|uniref:Uncharacterized protein n=1 Tax=Robiginitalea biformata (strain ATCC BAA-864 / DSM 15991 / KCTC 12146 / HTCC2501) TaxID=313596 RepID=A4CNW7_ROBBH|nr:glycosyl hydrolase [Robiginitalea biformata]EAR14584.1 hypothetical protein RB2501_00871 [Robiginitalea biformata HTCC2501]